VGEGEILLFLHIGKECGADPRVEETEFAFAGNPYARRVNDPDLQFLVLFGDRPNGTVFDLELCGRGPFLRPGLLEFFGKFELPTREPQGLVVEQEGVDLIAGDGKDLVGDGNGLVLPGNVLVVREKMLVGHWYGLLAKLQKKNCLQLMVKL